MTSDDAGMGVLVLSVFAAFMFPAAAKWILLGLVVFGLWGHLKK